MRLSLWTLILKLSSCLVPASTLFVMADGKGVNVYSTKDEKNTDKHIAYTKGDEITSLYKIVVSVEYDADRDGSYSEQVYSISTDD